MERACVYKHALFLIVIAKHFGYGDIRAWGDACKHLCSLGNDEFAIPFFLAGVFRMDRVELEIEPGERSA